MATLSPLEQARQSAALAFSMHKTAGAHTDRVSNIRPVKVAGVFDFLRRSRGTVASGVSGGVQAGAPLAAARQAASKAHATHLGTAMPSVDALRSQYGAVTPEQFRATYAQSLKETGTHRTPRGHSPASRGVESFLQKMPDGSTRVSDTGLAYLHANKNRVDTQSLVPQYDADTHQWYSIHGGAEGMANGGMKLDIHGNPAVDDLDENIAALAKMKPRDAATKSLWERIHAADTKAQKIRAAAPTLAAPTAARPAPTAADAAATVRPVRRPAPQTMDTPTVAVPRPVRVAG